ncbi:hypothetical protein T439DRAFT_212506 [Meredithblackwellia eburnea MCA 4105]
MATELEDVCWSLHEFQAENEDELSFGINERIVILERDENYHDGWYQGRNVAGEVGLFPQSYTTFENPALASPSASPTTDRSPTSPHTPEPIIAQHMNDVERTLGQLQLGVSHDKSDATSFRSKASRDDRQSDDEGETSGPVSNPRAVLALKAQQNAEREAREEKERAEQRRKDDEAAYAATRGDSGLIEGLQLSDESDLDEEDLRHLPVGRAITKQPSIGSVSGAPVPPADGAPIPEDAVEELSTASLAAPVISRTADGDTTDDDRHSVRSRANTIASVYPDSTAGDASPPPPLPSSSPFFTSPALGTSTAEPSAPSSPVPEQKVNGSPALNGSPKPSSPSLSGTALEAVGAGFTGAAAVVAAAAVAGGSALKKGEDSLKDKTPSPQPHVSLPSQAEAVLKAPSPIIPSPALTSLPVVALSADHLAKPVAPPATTVEAARGTPTPTPAALNAHTYQAAPISPIKGADFTDSPAASLTSETHSRSSSRMGAAPLTAASTGTAETSPRESSFGGFNGPQALGGPKALPYDPREWGVEEVVEWGRSKGFDALTLSKFQEHEISGDVLIEMDVNMLKEIDLVAFGRRVHIYNAIKELRGRTSRPGSEIQASRPGSSMALSPTLSGYEPDSPGTMGFASPSSMNFRSPTSQGPAMFEHGHVRHDSDLGAGAVNGLGFDSDAASLQRSINARPVSLRSKPSYNAGHQRSTTVDSFATSADATVDDRIPEEREEDVSPAKPVSKTPAALVIPPKNRPSSASRDPKTPSTTSLNRSDSSSAPNSPRVNKKSELSSFFGATLGRSRKPPPRVPSAIFDEKNRPLTASQRSRQQLSSSTGSRRSTRLFGAFSGGSGSEKSSFDTNRRSDSLAASTNTRNAPSSMTPKEVDAAGDEMVVKQTEAVTSGNLLEKIGTPDYSGWMRKKGEKYSTWKQRFFVLKGIHLYYLKSESEQKVKGFVNLTGYRVLADSDIHPGEFGFKIVHDVDRTHYFSAAEQVTIRTWMKEIMKATIGRDYTAPVVSSCNIETMPLQVAQSMSPRPRPPSPSTRARVQRERYNGSPNTLTPKDAMILMEFTAGSPLIGSPTMGVGSPTTKSSEVFRSMSLDDGESPRETASVPVETSKSAPHSAPSQPAASRADTRELLAWVNANLPSSTPKATDLSSSLRSGQILVRLLENLSHTSSGITDATFATFRPPTKDQLFDAAYFDTVFATFDYFTPLVSTDDISMDDMLSGNEPQLVLLLERIKAKF